MKKRILSSLLVTLFVATAAGCGGGKSLSGTDSKLTGQWIAEKLNAKGDRILLVFNEEKIDVPATDETPYNPYDRANTKDPHSIRLVAIRPGGDTYSIDTGLYDIEKSKISFDLAEIDDFTSPFTLTSATAEAPAQLTLGTEVYFKVMGSLDGPQLGGQIQISQAATDEGVSVSSVRVTSALPAGSVVPGEILVKYKDEADAPDAEGDASGSAALTVSSLSTKVGGLSNAFVEKVVTRSGYHKVTFHQTFPLGSASLSVAGAPKTLSEIGFAKLAGRDEFIQNTVQAVEELRKDPKVEYAVPNRILKTTSLAAPTDTYYADQWNLDAMNVTDAWGAVAPTKEVVVAVIDTGIVDHPDLSGKVLKTDGYDFVHDKIPGIDDLDLDGTPGPDNDATDPGDHQAGLGLPGGSSWHGTHISGIIAASIDNGAGIAGIATSVKILPIRAMGLEGNGTLDDVAQAIYYAAKLKNVADCATGTAVTDGAAAGTYAIDESSAAWTSCNPSAKPRKKADVINLSLGAPLSELDAAPLNEAVNAAAGAGVLVVAAAGNEAMGPGYCLNASGTAYVADASCKFYPAANPNAISVGAVYANLAFAAAYSNYGVDGAGNTQFLVAPGGSGSASILSTVKPEVLGGYAELMGTSQAAAHVSGVAALIWSDKPALSLAQIKQALSSSAIDLGTPGRDKYYGYGLVNAAIALVKARELAGSPTALPGDLKLSSKNADFGTLGTSHTVIITGGMGSISGIQARYPDGASSPWLKPALNVGTTPAVLTFTIDRTGLAAGDYSEQVEVLSNADSSVTPVTLNIKMKVGAATTSGGTELDNLRKEIEDFLSGGGTGFDNAVDLGEVVILLIDANAGGAAYYTKTDFTANYNFQFGGINPGKYYLLAGVDENLDGTICKEGETEPCFAYPSFANPEVIEVTATTKKNDLVLVY